MTYVSFRLLRQSSEFSRALRKGHPLRTYNSYQVTRPRRRERCAMKLQDEKLFRQQCYIDGEWVDAYNRATIPVKDPASGETIGTVPKMGAEETRRAIEAADKALPA